MEIGTASRDPQILEVHRIAQPLETQWPERRAAVPTDQSGGQEPVYLVDQIRLQKRSGEPATAFDEDRRQARLGELPESEDEVDMP